MIFSVLRFFYFHRNRSMEVFDKISDRSHKIESRTMHSTPRALYFIANSAQIYIQWEKKSCLVNKILEEISKQDKCDWFCEFVLGKRQITHLLLFIEMKKFSRSSCSFQWMAPKSMPSMHDRFLSIDINNICIREKLFSSGKNFIILCLKDEMVSLIVEILSRSC